MTIGSFLKLVEIQTKVASVIPFLLGTFYALYRYDSFKPVNFLLMLASLLCIDMATTAINNYQDYKKALKTHGYGYESHNAIVSYKLQEKTVLTTILCLIAIAMAAGFALFLQTNAVVLVLGAISFMVGILYSFGPVPISRTPFGEIFSGGFMGMIIPFIAIYIHAFDQGLLSLIFQAGLLNIRVNVPELIYILLLSLPAAAGIANIMLANNICDIEDDIENKRYTLPVYIGKSRALLLFRALYYIGFASLLIALLLGAMPWTGAIALLTLLTVNKHLKVFDKLQTKKDTFILAVKNFVLVNGVLAAAIAAGAAIRFMGNL